MKRFYSIILSLLILLVLGSCKTNINNMRGAYETTIQGNQNRGEDSLIYTALRRDMKQGTMVVRGDTVNVSTQFVSITKDGGGTRQDLKPFCVVAAQFKQIFNAKSMRTRLMEEGYPNTFLVQIAEPYYYVVVASYDTAAEAVDCLNRLKKSGKAYIKAPCPFILQPANTPDF